jgi:hypothetical protein
LNRAGGKAGRRTLERDSFILEVHMIRRFLVAVRVVAVVALAGATGASVSVIAAGQSTAAKKAAPAKASTSASKTAALRTPWGDPDIQGTWTSNSVTGVPLERNPEYGEREFLTDEEYVTRQKSAEVLRVGERMAGGTGSGPSHWYEWWGRESRRTSMVIDPKDGRLPWKSEDVKRALRRPNPPASWLDLHTWDRCITRGLPNGMTPSAYNNGYEILQVPGYVVIHYEMVHDVRVIPLDGSPHVDKNIRQWLGDSRGHWEGNTLVVDVSNFSNKTDGTLPTENGFYTGGGEALHLIERFTRTDAETLTYAATVEDPTKFSRPWTLSIPLAKDDTYRIYEYACHEGNYAVPNILSGARAAEKEQ